MMFLRTILVGGRVLAVELAHALGQVESTQLGQTENPILLRFFVCKAAKALVKYVWQSMYFILLTNPIHSDCAWMPI